MPMKHIRHRLHISVKGVTNEIKTRKENDYADSDEWFSQAACKQQAESG